jgi:hypothetical protein
VGLPRVGIFFVVDNQVIVDAVPVEDGEPYDDSIGHGGHYEFWTLLKPRTLIERKFKERAYDAYPRGRVVFFKQKNQFVLYADRCLKYNNLKKISKMFYISDYLLDSDEHYRCAKCNIYYLE